MKLRRLCSGTIQDHQIVKFDSQNLVVPYDNSGDVAGIVQGCEMLTEVDENNNETTNHVAYLAVSQTATCILSGTASQNGCVAYANNDKVSSTGTVEIGKILPKEYPRTGDYQDGDIVVVLLN